MPTSGTAPANGSTMSLSDQYVTRTKSREQKHHFFLVLASWLLGSAKFASLQRQKPAMFAQMPLVANRHHTGAVCTTSSDGCFRGAFLLASGLSNSSDMVHSPTSRNRWSPVQRAQLKTFCRNYGCNRRPGRRLEPNARLCVAVAQVVLRSNAAVSAATPQQIEQPCSVHTREPANTVLAPVSCRVLFHRTSMLPTRKYRDMSQAVHRFCSILIQRP
jgi:hypothetical protein